MIAWSYGGGVQSVAIGVLIRQGVLPKPDLAGIADTGREMPSTFDYLHKVMQPYLDPVGVKVEVIPHSLARVDLYDPSSGLTLVPAYTRTARPFEGLFGAEVEYEDGRLGTFCSDRWKRRVMERWLRSEGVKKCDQWIGYSTDESWRVKDDVRQWCRHAFPLIEKGLNRAMCKRLIEAAGLPLPRKSRCWMCPHQNAEEWAEVKADPELFARAVQLEREINDNDPRQTGGLFLWAGRVPLPLADFCQDDGLVPPGRPCETTGCWT